MERGLTWLIAEDEADIRNLIVMMCQVWGKQTLVFESGQKVWEWLDEVEAGSYDGDLPGLALMDIRMPGKKGNEVATRMRGMNELGELPIVLMTAFTLSEEDQKALKDDGADQIIHKPLPDFEQLRTILHEAIENKQKTT